MSASDGGGGEGAGGSDLFPSQQHLRKTLKKRNSETFIILENNIFIQLTSVSE